MSLGGCNSISHSTKDNYQVSWITLDQVLLDVDDKVSLWVIIIVGV